MNITIHNITESMVYNTVLGVVCDKGVTQLIRNFKCIVIVVESGYSFQNMPHSMIFFFSETNSKDTQYKTYTATKHYS